MAEAAQKTEQTWYTTDEAAEYLRITPEALRKHVQRGKLKASSTAALGRKFGLRFRRETLDAFITGTGENDNGR